MKRWTRSGAANSKLIIILVVLIIIGGGYWMIRWRSSAAEKAKYQQGGDATYKLYCPGWEEPRMYTKEEAEKLKLEDGKVENPDTGVCECKWGSKPRGDVISVP